MKNAPINDLRYCSVKGCRQETVVLIQKKIGDQKVLFGYCQFHEITSATLFPRKRVKEIHV